MMYFGFFSVGTFDVFPFRRGRNAEHFVTKIEIVGMRHVFHNVLTAEFTQPLSDSRPQAGRAQYRYQQYDYHEFL